MTTVIDGFDELQGIFDDIAKDFDAVNYGAFFGDVVERLRELHQNYFLGSFGPSGDDWPEWRWRDPDVSNDHMTLIASGRLRDSVLTTGPDHIETITENALTWGTSVPYAAIHNFGGVTVTPPGGLVGRFGGYLPGGKPITIPQREFMGITDADADAIASDAADTVIAQLKE